MVLQITPIMNLNRTSIFSMPSSEESYTSNSNVIDVSRLIKVALVVVLVVLMLMSNAILEYFVIAAVAISIQRMYAYYKDIMSIDLHFSNDDLDMNEIINDLWK